MDPQTWTLIWWIISVAFYFIPCHHKTQVLACWTYHRKFWYSPNPKCWAGRITLESRFCFVALVLNPSPLSHQEKGWSFFNYATKSHIAQRLEPSIQPWRSICNATWCTGRCFCSWGHRLSPIITVLESLKSSVSALMSFICVCLNICKALITTLAHSAIWNVSYYYFTHFHLISAFKWHFNTSPHLSITPFAFNTLLLLRLYYYLS